MRKRYNTPHRSRVVKTRMTEEEYAEFAERLSAYNMSKAEFIRQAITGATILCCGSLWRKSLSMKALPLTGNAGASYADRKSKSIILLSAR